MQSLVLIAALDSAPTPSGDAARWICSLQNLEKLSLHDSSFHAKFYQEVSAKVRPKDWDSVALSKLEDMCIVQSDF